MRTPLLLFAAALTSIAAVLLVARRGFGGLAAAVGLVLETVGATVMFFVANVAVASTIVLLARRIWFYTTLWDVTDLTILILSALQALVLTAWTRAR